MPPADEEIRELNENSPRKTEAEELKERWLEDHLGTNDKDYYDFKFKPEYAQWQNDTTALIRNNNARWEIEKLEIPALEKIDSKLATGTIFDDTKAGSIYTALTQIFGDEKIYPFSLDWALPSNARNNWQDLLDITNKQVQRNATKLASVIATARTVATDEVKRAGGAGGDAAVTDWRNSELYKTLGPLEQALKQWDDLLGADVFPHSDALKIAANTCNERFSRFCTQHQIVYAKPGTIPFIKYQLLATMRSLAEKVASQLAARAGQPAFSAMYERINDIPDRNISSFVEKKAKYLTESYGHDLGQAWDSQLISLMGTLKDANSEAATKLQAAFKALSEKSPPIKLRTSLDRWNAGYKTIGSNLRELPNMHASVGEFAFGLAKYKKAADEVLKDYLLKDKSGYLQVQKVKQLYQEMFDGVAMCLQQDILFCKNVLNETMGL